MANIQSWHCAVCWKTYCNVQQGIPQLQVLARGCRPLLLLLGLLSATGSCWLACLSTCLFWLHLFPVAVSSERSSGWCSRSGRLVVGSLLSCGYLQVPDNAYLWGQPWKCWSHSELQCRANSWSDRPNSNWFQLEKKEQNQNVFSYSLEATLSEKNPKCRGLWKWWVSFCRLPWFKR